MAKLFNLARVTTVTPGTGTVTLGAAATGFLTFAQAGVPSGVTVSYGIENGSQSEVGTGVYDLATLTLTRPAVTNSTNSNAAINLAGTSEVYITAIAADFREILTANRTYYVRTDGSDSNTGLFNTAAGAFLTLQKPYDVWAATLDLAGYTVTAQVADGTYTAGVIAKVLVGQAGYESVVYQGNAVTPTNVVVNATNQCFLIGSGTGCLVQDMSLTSSASVGIESDGSGWVGFGNISFGACFYAGIAALGGTILQIIGKENYAITGGGQYHIVSDSGGTIYLWNPATITITSTPTFQVFAYCGMGSKLFGNAQTYSGALNAATQRFYVELNGVIQTYGSGATYFPGTVAGAIVEGGVYDSVADQAINAVTGNFSFGTRTPDSRLHAEVDSASTNVPVPVSRITATSTGTVAVGFGPQHLFEAENASGTNRVVGTIGGIYTDPTDTSEDADVVITTMAAGAAATETFRTGFAPIALVQHDNLTLLANYGIIAPDVYEIPTGLSLEYGAGAIMEIT